MVAMTALNPDEPRHVKFHANRPFVYIITERQTGAIFFVGQYLGE
jgi:serpin B